MKKSKKIGLVIFSIIVVLTVLAIVAAAIIGAICIKKWIQSADEKTVEIQAKEALDSVIGSAVDTDEEPDELLGATESRSGYEVLSYSETETGAFVTFRVYAPDLYKMAKELDANNEYATEEELKSLIVDAIGKAQLVEREVTLEFIATENGYEPILTMEFFDAYYGGVLKLLDEMLSNNSEEVAQ